jgi:hypothetical protein
MTLQDHKDLIGLVKEQFFSSNKKKYTKPKRDFSANCWYESACVFKDFILASDGSAFEQVICRF